MPGTYTHTTFGEAKDRLASLLGDPTKTFYQDAELGQYIIEALRWWGLSAMYFRESATVETVSGQAFYDLTEDVLDATQTDLLQSLTVTDRDVISDLLYNLMEDQITNWAGGWVGSEQFSLEEISDLLSKSRDQLLKLTGVVGRRQEYILAGGQQRVFLDDDLIKILRAEVDEDGSDGPLLMWAGDSQQIQSTTNGGLPVVGRPRSYLTNYTPTLALDVYPPAQTQSTLGLHVVESDAVLDPTVAATPLGLPDDACWIAKYRTMDDLLGGDGLGRAPQISEYAASRWEQGVDALSQYQSIVWSTVGGKRMTVSSLAELDVHRPRWQQTSGTPRSLHLLNWNVFAVYPVPDGVYRLELEIVRKAPIPTSDDDFIQVGREQMDAIWDYASHIAMIKCQGTEFDQSMDLLASAQASADDYLALRASESVNWEWVQTLTGQDRREQRPFRRPRVAEKAKENANVGTRV